MIKKLISHYRTRKNSEKVMVSDNPYLQARLEWNYVFGDIRKAKQQWFMTAMGSMLANILLIAGMILISLQTKCVPYVIKEDQLGNSFYAGFLDRQKNITPLEINAYLRQYIINARTVMVDAFAEKRAIDAVYSASLPAARKTLDTFYRAANPFRTANENIIEVRIKGVIQKSNKTWQVDWSEITRTLDGQQVGEKHFEALITITHMKVNNPELLNINPLGIYIEHISWAEQQ